MADTKTVVVAIGGNALSPSGESASIHNQFRHTRESLLAIIPLAIDGWHIAIVHGNGPQVGNALVRNEAGRDIVEALPLGILVAGTAGWIGYMIQQSLTNELIRANCERRVVTLVCQVRVDVNDPALRTPTKFVGQALSEPAAMRLRAAGECVEIDGNGNLKRRVPSPVPVEIVESRMIADLVRAGDIVIAAGGGGIPVYSDPVLGLEGIDAVVDKDRSAAILARDIGADLLVILTDVDAVYTGWGTENATRLGRLTTSEALALLASDELGTGSMKPKLEAATSFVLGGGSRAVIAALENGPAAVAGQSGTEIVPDAPDSGARPSTSTGL